MTDNLYASYLSPKYAKNEHFKLSQNKKMHINKNTGPYINAKDRQSYRQQNTHLSSGKPCKAIFNQQFKINYNNKDKFYCLDRNQSQESQLQRNLSTRRLQQFENIQIEPWNGSKSGTLKYKNQSETKIVKIFYKNRHSNHDFQNHKIRQTKCSKCSYRKQNQQQQDVNNIQNALQFETSYEQRLKWRLQLQLMMKKRKKISGILRLKNGGHPQPSNINTDQLYTSAKNNRMMRVDEKISQTVDPELQDKQKSLEKYDLLMYSNKIQQQSLAQKNKTQTNFQNCQASQIRTLRQTRDGYTGLIKKRTKKMGTSEGSVEWNHKINTLNVSKNINLNLNISKHVQQYANSNVLDSTANFSTKIHNLCIRAKTERVNSVGKTFNYGTISSVSPQKDNKVSKCITNRVSRSVIVSKNSPDFTQSKQKKFRFTVNKHRQTMNNLATVHGIKQKLKQINIVDPYHRQHIKNQLQTRKRQQRQQNSTNSQRCQRQQQSPTAIRNSINIQKQQIIKFNDQNAVGFGSYTNQIDCCTISKVKYHKKQKSNQVVHTKNQSSAAGTVNKKGNYNV